MSIVAKSIRLCFQGTSYIAPRLAGWAALQLFIRPMDKKRTIKAELQASIDATLAQASSGLLETSAGPVMLHHWQAENSPYPTAKVLLVHGWTSRSDYMLNYVPALLARGISCYAMDFPAHGRSPGKTLIYTQAIAAIRDVQWSIGPLLAQIGHSFGGAMSMMAARTEAGEPAEYAPRHLVLVAAPTNLNGVVQSYGRMIGLSAAAQRDYEARLLALGPWSIEELSAAAIQPFYSGRVTIVHDENDTEVRYANALETKQAFPQAELLTTQGLGHRRILRTPEITAQIVERIAADLPLPKCA